MNLLRNRVFLVAAIVLLLMPGAWMLARDKGTDDPAIVARVKRGDFTVTVTTSGELSALESVRISAPANARQAQIYQMRIASLVPEGDVVAELDRSEIASKLTEVRLALQKAQAVHEQAMLDSTLTLSQAREEIRSMEFALEEKQLAKEQSLYEPPTVKRQAEIDLEKAERALAQGKLDYVTKTAQARAKMREVGADVGREQNKLNVVQDVMTGFTVRAPSPGMVIYQKEWNGRKRETGSQVGAWDPTVATLPDLSKMESITYVNEIDIRKIEVDQPVAITLDSDPSKHLTGTVTKVANVGEQRPNSDAKVFEVRITIEQADTTLRPGMTTGNSIETLRSEDALFISIEALASENGIPFVYLQSGGGTKKQEVVTGAMNDDEVIIAGGLKEDDRVLLVPPANRADLELRRLPDSPVDTTAIVGGDTATGSRRLQPDTVSPNKN